MRKLCTLVFLGGAGLGAVLSLAATKGSYLSGTSMQDAEGCRSHLTEPGEMTFEHAMNFHAMAEYEISEAKGFDETTGAAAYASIFAKNRFLDPTPIHPIFKHLLDGARDELQREQSCPIYSDEIPMDHDRCTGNADECNVKFDGWGPMPEGDTYK